MIPENELGVIIVFAQESREIGVEFDSIQSAFPDAVVFKDGIDYRVEFELKSSHFLQHGHDPRKCDLIICWEDDDEDNTIPTLVLSDTDWKTQKWGLPTKSEQDVAYWRQRAILAERQVKAMGPKETVFNKAASLKRNQILTLAKTHPEMSQAEIARIVNASRSHVSEVMSEITNGNHKVAQAAPSYVSEVLNE